MANTKIYTECIICTDGQAGGVPCEYCSGNEIILWGELEYDLADIMNKCNDIMDKCNEIKAVVDAL